MRTFIYNESKLSINYFTAFDYYFDCEAEETRYLCLDTTKRERKKKQEQFLYDTLRSTPETYHIVLIAHIWLEWDMSNKVYLPNKQTSAMFDIFREFNMERGQIVLILGGHIHKDFITFEYAGGIPLVLSDCDAIYKSCNRFYPPKEGSPLEQRLNCVILDYEKDMYHFIRIGRGQNVSFKIEKSNISKNSFGRINLL